MSTYPLTTALPLTFLAQDCNILWISATDDTKEKPPGSCNKQRNTQTAACNSTKHAQLTGVLLEPHFNSLSALAIGATGSSLKCMKGRSLEWCSRLSDAATSSQLTVVTLSWCIFSPLLQPCRLRVLSALSQLLLKTNCLSNVFTFTRTTITILKNM